MSAEPQSDDTDELVHCDCGHEVPEDEVVPVPEILLCERCYTPFDVTDWPEKIGTYKHRVIESRGTSKAINTTYLLGLDARGRAVYYCGENNRILTFVPKNDEHYRQDRQEALESKKEHHQNLPHLRPRKNVTRRAGAGLPSNDPFVTLPNGDHIVRVNTSEKIKKHELDEWMVENTGDWQQVHPDKVDAFGLDQFGTTSGKRTEDYECDECGHTVDDMDPEDAHPDGCPECGSRQFYPQTPN